MTSQRTTTTSIAKPTVSVKHGTTSAPVGLAVPTRVVHCKRDRYDVYIGRPSKWGNPYVIGRDGTREQVIAKYRAWVLRRPELVAALGELRGKVLGLLVCAAAVSRRRLGRSHPFGSGEHLT